MNHLETPNKINLKAHLAFLALVPIDKSGKDIIQTSFKCDIWGFHGGEDSSQGNLGCDAVVVRYQMKSEDESSYVVWIVGILPQHYTAPQAVKPRPKSFKWNL
jgi:hypothetical protein